jgi:hypothetical protein
MTEEIRKARRALDLLLRDARSTLRALNIELQEEDVERGSPISLSSEAFERAVLAPAHNDVAG